MSIVFIDSASNKDSNGCVIVDSGQNSNENLECRLGARHSKYQGSILLSTLTKDRYFMLMIVLIDRA